MITSSSNDEDGWYLSTSDIYCFIIKSSMFVVRLRYSNEQLYKTVVQK